jgi:hypothetical protein
MDSIAQVSEMNKGDHSPDSSGAVRVVPNRSGRAPGQQYIIFPDPLGIRAWYVGSGGQLERGPSGHKEPALRNKMTRWGHREITLMDLNIGTLRIVPPDERL